MLRLRSSCCASAYHTPSHFPVFSTKIKNEIPWVPITHKNHTHTKICVATDTLSMRINMEELSQLTWLEVITQRFSYNIKVKWYELVSQASMTIRIVASIAPSAI